ncbi:MAG: hypothetical protein K2Q20_12995 [Phycisphaerales bacterium]|nr:hypothetical protein [Phycisphaerales bacterium]
MRAVCWHGSKDVRVEDVPAPEVLNPRDAIVRDLRLRPAPVQRPVRRHEVRRRAGPRVHGRGCRRRLGREQSARGRPRRGALRHLLRLVLLLQALAVFLLRQLQPERRRQRGRLRQPDGRPLRLLAPHRWLRRRPGRAGPCPLRGLRPREGPPRRARREGAVHLRHPAHGVDGRRVLRPQARRHRGRVGVRACRASGGHVAAGHGRRTRVRNRSCEGASGKGRVAGCHPDQSRHAGRLRNAPRPDQRPWSRRMPGRRGHGGPRLGPHGRGRPRKAGDEDRERPPERAA